MNDADFESMESLLEGHFDKPLAGRPPALTERVKEAFYPLHWDGLTPSGRRSLARQADARDAPSMQEQNAYFWQEAVEVSKVEQAIQGWELMGTQTITEKLEKSKVLDELRDRLKKLHALEHQPLFHITNWATLAERQAPRPQAATVEPVGAVVVAVEMGTDKNRPLVPEEKGLATKDIASAFDRVKGWPSERWPKNLSQSKWLHPARIAIGAAGGASSVWSPMMLMQLMHHKAKGAREKEKLMKVFNSRFTLNPVLAPWRDDFNEYYATYCADY